jgi:ABC-type cobalamin/Fe3+-siderophores transport system ATPase subunit
LANEIIKLSNLSIGYGKKIIAKDINFSVLDNDFIGLVEPNCAGKTTLLKTLLDTLKPLAGTIGKKKI